MVQRSEGALRSVKEGTQFCGKEFWSGDQRNQGSFRAFWLILNWCPHFTGLRERGTGWTTSHLCWPKIMEPKAFPCMVRGTVDCRLGERSLHLAHTCMHRTVCSSLLSCSVMLADHNPGDGGFVWFQAVTRRTSKCGGMRQREVCRVSSAK